MACVHLEVVTSTWHALAPYGSGARLVRRDGVPDAGTDEIERVGGVNHYAGKHTAVQRPSPARTSARGHLCVVLDMVAAGLITAIAELVHRQVARSLATR